MHHGCAPCSHVYHCLTAAASSPGWHASLINDVCFQIAIGPDLVFFYLFLSGNFLPNCYSNSSEFDVLTSRITTATNKAILDSRLRLQRTQLNTVVVWRPTGMVLPPGELLNITSSMILSIDPTAWKHDFIRKTGSTQRIATPSGDDQATATGNTHKNRWS